MKISAIDRIGGGAAIVAAVGGLAYSVAFVVLKNPLLYSLFLLLGGVLTTAALVALFDHLAEVDAAVARLGLALALTGALGAAIHGAYDLANVIHPPASSLPALADLPSQIDPRGVLTFGVAGVGMFVAAYLIGRSRRFPAAFAALTYVLAALLVIIYLGRLIVLTPTSPLILVPAAITGLVVNPAWYLWLGLALQRREAASAAAQPVTG